MNKNVYTIDDARKKIQYYCMYQDRCHKEVLEKLQQMQLIPSMIDILMAELIQDNFLNEERFAQSFARGKFRYKKWGRNRIVRELKFRTISEYNIRTALKEISEEEYEDTLHEIAQKRLASIRETNALKRKKKLCDYLLYRGWESHLVYAKASELID